MHSANMDVDTDIDITADTVQPTTAPSLNPRRDRCNCMDCAPGLYRYHPPPANLQVASHDVLALAKHAVASFSVPPSQLSPDQHWVRAQFKTQTMNFWSYKHGPTGKKTPSRFAQSVFTRLIPSAVDTFNELFFLSAFDSDTLNVRRRHFQDPNEKRGQTSFPDAWHVDIGINPDHPAHRHPITHEFNHVAILSTLLREMCHAFLGCYCCEDGNDCGTAECSALNKTNFGATSHGRAWQTLAKAIEDVAPRLFPDIRIDLGRREAMVKEIEKGKFRPSECDIRDFCGGFEVLVRVLMMNRVRSDDSAMRAAIEKWANLGKKHSRLMETNAWPFVVEEEVAESVHSEP